MPRFVVLYHVTPPTRKRANHWDLMLELPISKAGESFDPVDWAGERKLITWSLEVKPFVFKTAKAIQLVDHRQVYLTFEGELSANRGFVTRELEGEVEWLESSLDIKKVRLVSSGRQWLIRLKRLCGETFEVEVLNDLPES